MQVPVLIPENTAGGFERFFESWRDMLLESYTIRIPMLSIPQMAASLCRCMAR